MSEYILQLKSVNDTLDLPLSAKNAEDVLYDYFECVSEKYVYNDHYYYVTILDDDKQINVNNLFVNNEAMEDKALLSGKKPECIFKDCFVIIKIEVIINGEAFITPNIRVAMKDGTINSSIINMIDYIYDNCDDYLYEEHKHSKAATGVMPNPNVSIDTKLSLLNEIYEAYVKVFNFLKNSAQSKLININRMGDFTELKTISRNTINCIVIHPEELQPVNYNSGIIYNHQHYQPRKTLVQSVSYSLDIYENQVIVGFLKCVINELENIKIEVENFKKRNSIPYKKNGYVDSSYYIYTRNIKSLNGYLESIDASLDRFAKIYFEYKKILNVSDIAVISQPQYTNIFRRIMPYNIIFEKITKWFNCGNYDIMKSDLLLSFISISRIYEYFCLLKLNRSIEKCGYNLINSFPFKYNEGRYYHNTTYNNTFEFEKDKNLEKYINLCYNV